MNGRMLILGTMLLLLPVSAPAAEDSESVERGRRIVEANCANCHAIGAEDTSPLPGAPELRSLSERYPVDALEEAFAEGIVTGHPEMPEFEADPDQIEAIIEYLASIQAQ